MDIRSDFDMERFRLKRSMSVRRAPNGAITFGMAPPRHFILENPPEFLSPLLDLLNEPHSLEEVSKRLIDENQEREVSDISQVWHELIDLNVLEAPKQIGRYDRHELYFDIFNVSADQYALLANKKIGLIGAGGIGSTCALLLAAAGIGTISLADDDLLEETNLPRVVLLEESDIGLPKIQQIQEKIKARNSKTRIESRLSKISDPGDILSFFGNCDAWILSADTPSQLIQEWTNSAALQTQTPYISAGYAEINGMIGPFIIPGETPCHNCRVLEGNVPSGLQINKKVQATSYGPLNTIVSAMAVNEVIRFLLGLDITTKGSQIILNSSNYEMVRQQLSFSKSCTCRS